MTDSFWRIVVHEHTEAHKISFITYPSNTVKLQPFKVRLESPPPPCSPVCPKVIGLSFSLNSLLGAELLSNMNSKTPCEDRATQAQFSWSLGHSYEIRTTQAKLGQCKILSQCLMMLVHFLEKVLSGKSPPGKCPLWKMSFLENVPTPI